LVCGKSEFLIENARHPDQVVMPPQLRRSEWGVHVGILPPAPSASFGAKRFVWGWVRVIPESPPGVGLTRSTPTYACARTLSAVEESFNKLKGGAADRIGTRSPEAKCLEV
jgi:hypothetical protein